MEEFEISDLTMRISKTTKIELDKLKINKRESYNSVIQKLIEFKNKPTLLSKWRRKHEKE